MTAPNEPTSPIENDPLRLPLHQWSEAAKDVDALRRLKLRRPADLLFYFPRYYEDQSDIRTIATLEEDQLQTVVGRVVDVNSRSTRRGGSLTGVLISDGTGHLRGMWFNQPYMSKRLRSGDRVRFTGRPKLEKMAWKMSHPQFHVLDDEEPVEETVGLLPVYGLTEGLPQWRLRRLARAVVDRCADQLEEALSEELRQRNDIAPIIEAVQGIHFPESKEQADRARHRFVYQELLVLQIALAITRYNFREGEEATPLPASSRIDARIRRLFPFRLTDDQQQAIAEISGDMDSSRAMNRLLQGDVGTGKTVVAVYAMLLAVAHGCQAAMMAPTEILARQHYRTLTNMLDDSSVRIELLLGGMQAKRRELLLTELKSGDIDIAVGTQAMLQEDVDFKDLGVAVIDEQHKFGVRQRAMLRGSGRRPHYLVMTATPIPRTVTMTFFGDLDVSTIRQSPPGRPVVNTYLVPPEKRASWWSFFSEKLREGRQGYVVAPLVDTSETVDARSAEQLYEDLSRGELADFRVGLLHGRMTTDEKDTIMQQFRDRQLDVLVGTTVLEVGVDIENATLMAIESGQRFGLSQLHQLRGRISRGKYPGFCGIFANVSNEQAEQRMAAIVSTTDGFQLAEIDFELRGPGDLLGTAQHGLPPLRIADLVRDAKIVEQARRDAAEIVDGDPKLEKPEHQRLRSLTAAQYGDVLDLGDVG